MPFWHIAHLKASNIMASVTLEHSLTGSQGTVGRAGGWP